MSSHEDREQGSPTPVDWDAEMAEQLRDLAQHEPGPGPQELDQLYASVRSQCDANDRTLAGFLRTRATWMRRLLVSAALALIAFTAWRSLPAIAESARGTPWKMTLAAYLSLLLIATFLATRPLQLPPLAPWKAKAVAAVTVTATLIAALWPRADAAAASSSVTAETPAFMFMACMGMGLLLGVPVYALLRLFDQGNSFGNLMAAVAAGLAGNLLLNMHCPVHSGPHALFGHASVAVIFVLGLGLVHRWIPSK